MAAPLVSVIVNNFNYADYVGEAIASALQQTYRPLEVLAVDDGSTDNSRQIISSFSDRLLPLFKSNGGQTSAFNQSLKEAHGDVIIFLDADDTLLPTAVERAAPFFASSAISQVHWPLLEVDSRGKTTGSIRPPLPLSEGNLKQRVLAEGPYAIVSPPTSGNAWARWFLDEVFPLPERESTVGFGSASADAYLSALATIAGEIATVREPQGCYRVHGQNDYASLDSRKRLKQYVLRYDYICRGLADFCHARGLNADPEHWKSSDERLVWARGLINTGELLEKLLPVGSRFVIVDDDQWRESLGLSRYDCRPLMEQDGQYWGSPADDAQAIHELERQRTCGATALVVALPAFWWLDHYRRFFDYVRKQFRCVVANESMLLFELK